MFYLRFNQNLLETKEEVKSEKGSKNAQICFDSGSREE